MIGQMQMIPERGAGLLKTPNGEIVKLTDTIIAQKIDTVQITHANAATIPFGTEFVFAQNIANKGLLDCNFLTPRRLTSGEQMWVSKIGFYFPKFGGVTRVDDYNVMKVAENTYFVLKLGSNKEIAKGPVTHFPSGLGWFGQTTKNNDGVISMGYPAPKGIPPLAKKIYLDMYYDIDARIQFTARAWTGADVAGSALTPVVLVGTDGGVDSPLTRMVLARFVLHGRLKSPATL